MYSATNLTLRGEPADGIRKLVKWDSGAWQTAMRDWGEKHEYQRLQEDASRQVQIYTATFLCTQLAKRKGWLESRLQFVDKWVATLPDQEFLRMERLRLLDSLPPSDDLILAEGERVLSVARNETGPMTSPFGAQIQVASIWAKRGIALDRIPAMVDDALAAAAAARAQSKTPAPRTDMYPFPDQRLVQENQAFDLNTAAWQTLTAVYLKSGKPAQADAVLAKWQAALDERRKVVEECRKTSAASQSPAHNSTKFVFDSMVRSLPMSESQYFQAAAQVAAPENRKMDALAFYQAALRALAGAAGQAALSKSEAARSAGALWEELVGKRRDFAGMARRPGGHCRQFRLVGEEPPAARIQPQGPGGQGLDAVLHAGQGYPHERLGHLVRSVPGGTSPGPEAL